MLWELVTVEVPYKEVDSSAIMWGIGSDSLQLPVPISTPEGVKLLLKQCWSRKPTNRPSFRHIMKHLDIAKAETADISEADWDIMQLTWQKEIGFYMDSMSGESNKMKKMKIAEGQFAGNVCKP